MFAFNLGNFYFYFHIQVILEGDLPQELGCKSGRPESSLTLYYIQVTFFFLLTTYTKVNTLKPLLVENPPLKRRQNC